MSNNSSPILWIVLALIVIALMVWWLARSAAQRRELEARHFDAASLQERADQSTPAVRSGSDPASRTGAIAEQAQGEADAAEAEPERRAPEADRIDPEVETDDEGNRVDAASNTAGAGSAAVGAAAFTQEQDEPDLADAVNPFAAPQPGTGDPADVDDVDDVDDAADATNPDGAADSVDATDTAGDAPVDADWVNGPVDVDAELDEDQLRSDSESADWINGPDDAEPDGATVADPQGARASGAGEVPGTDESVSGTDESVPSTGEDGAGIDESISGAHEDDPGSDAVSGTGEGHDVGGSEAAPLGEGQIPQPVDEDGSGRREFSTFDEVTDGGFGVGSAAPVHDGAQPLGHPVKAWRDTMTFVLPGGQGYGEASPDVWFLNAEVARRAGFRGVER